MKKNVMTMKRITAAALSLLMMFAMLASSGIETAHAAEGEELSVEFVNVKDVYQEGDPVFIKATGHVQGAWVGLYKKEENTNPGAGGVNSLRWYYVANHDGEAIDITEDIWSDARKDKIRAGDYKVVLYGDDGYENILDTIYFTVGRAENPDASDELSLELIDGKASYMEDEPIYIKATGPDNGSWVGLYPKGAKHAPTPEGGELSSRWFYVSDQNGAKVNIISSSFDDNKVGDVLAGTYEIILFGDGGYTNIAKTIEVTITENPNKDHPIPADELSLNLVDAQESYKVGEPIYIRATGIAEGAWVGLYKKGDAFDPTSGGVPSLRWYYVANHNGEKLNIMDNQWQGDRYDAITEGEYDIVLFGDGGYGAVLNTITITIKGIIDIDINQFSLETDKTEYEYKEPIRVKASGTGIGGGAWVGLYTADTTTYDQNYLYYYFIKDFDDIYTTIQSRTKGANADTYVGDGTYKVVLFADSSYAFPILTKEIKVIRAVKTLKRLRDPGCVSMGLEYVVYEDGLAEYREVPSLGGHDWSIALNVDGTNTHRMVCRRDADHVKVEACSRTNGKILKAATTKSEGERQFTCDKCGHTFKETIPKLKAAPSLKAKESVYNGKDVSIQLNSILDANNTQVDSSFYTVTYPKTIKKVGKYTVTVKFTGDYSGTYKLTYKVLPKTVNVKKSTKGLKKAIKVKWKKSKAQTTGYQIQYSTSKKFIKSKTKTKLVKGIKKTSAKLTRLKAKKKYYIRIRTYKKVGKTKLYSAWSTYTKAVKTKR